MIRTSPRAATLAAGLLLLVWTPATAQERPVDRPDGRLQVDVGDMAVEQLLLSWARRQGKLLQLDPQLQQVRVRFSEPATLDALTLRHVLDMHDVVLVERDGVLEAHHRRNLAQKVGPPWDYVEGLAPRSDRFVTCVVPVKHGAGNAIFATLRGLLTRDTNRVGNILYVQGPEVIIVLDLGHNVRYYQEVIAALDRPPPLASSRVRLTVYEVERAWWTKARAERPSATALAATLRAASADAVTLLSEAALQGADPVAVERAVEVDGQQVRLSVEVGATARPQADGEGLVLAPQSHGGVALRLRLDVNTPSSAPLRLTAHTSFAVGEGAPSVQSFSGRAGPRPTDVVLVVERE